MKYTADKLKAQSDDLLQEFNEIVEIETTQLEEMSVKTNKLLNILEEDTYQFGEQVEANIKSLDEF